MGEKVLEINHLTKRFGGLVAVDDFSTVVESDSIHALIGPNGSGKTTTINMISGTLSPNEGSILYNGQNLVGRPTDEITKTGVVRTFQNIKLFASLNIVENIMVGGHCFTGVDMFTSLVNWRRRAREERELYEKAMDALNFIGLADKSRDEVSNLPYGQQKMLELARAMLSQPRVLLLDEPAAGLTPPERADLLTMLRRIFDQGIKLMLVEHNMDVVMNLCHKITVLSFGKKIAEGTPHEIQSDPEVIKAYLGERHKKIDAAGGRPHVAD